MRSRCALSVLGAALWFFAPAATAQTRSTPTVGADDLPGFGRISIVADEEPVRIAFALRGDDTDSYCTTPCRLLLPFGTVRVSADGDTGSRDAMTIRVVPGARVIRVRSGSSPPRSEVGMMLGAAGSLAVIGGVLVAVGSASCSPTWFACTNPWSGGVALVGGIGLVAAVCFAIAGVVLAANQHAPTTTGIIVPDPLPAASARMPVDVEPTLAGTAVVFSRRF